MKHSFAQGSPEEVFRRLDHTHRAVKDTLLNRAGLGDLGQPIILALLSCAPDRVIESQKELAHIMDVSPATITASLKSMERGGYIQRLPDENDMRRKRITITEKGLAAIEKVDAVFDRLDHGMYRGFSPEERARACALFSRMIDNLEQISVSDSPADLQASPSKEE